MTERVCSLCGRADPTGGLIETKAGTMCKKLAECQTYRRRRRALAVAEGD